MAEYLNYDCIFSNLTLQNSLFLEGRMSLEGSTLKISTAKWLNNTYCLYSLIVLVKLYWRLWSIEGWKWQMAAGLINISDVSLHLNEEIESISYHGEYYELNFKKGNIYSCEVTVVATPLDEVNIHFTPSISIPERKL